MVCDHDSRWRVRLTRRHRLVAGLAIIRSVRGDACDLALDLLEQKRQLAGIVDILVDQTVGDDLARLGINAEDVERFLEVLADPDTIVGTSVLIAAWGRRPA